MGTSNAKAAVAQAEAEEAFPREVAEDDWMALDQETSNMQLFDTPFHHRLGVA